MKLFLKIIRWIVTIFLLVILVLMVFQKVTNNKVAIGNIYIFQVVSGSMKPEYQIGDIIVSKKVEPSTLKVGDDVTYLGKKSNLKGLTIIHRIINVREDNGKYYFVTKGIANENKDPEINQDDIYGKVIYHTILFSFVGRLMTNVVIYYLLFITVGVSFAYDVISSFRKDDEEVD